MLTKIDLSQIRKVVREEVEAEVSDAKTAIESQIILSKMQLKHEIGELDDRLKNTEIRLSGLDKRLDGIEKDLKDVKKSVRKTEKTVNVMIDQFDKEIVGTQKRVTKIETHLQI